MFKRHMTGLSSDVDGVAKKVTILFSHFSTELDTQELSSQLSGTVASIRALALGHRIAPYSKMGGTGDHREIVVIGMLSHSPQP